LASRQGRRVGIETAALMLGSGKSRGYCLEMICADFLAGAHLEMATRRSCSTRSHATTSSCPANSSRLFSRTCVRRCPENDSPQSRSLAAGSPFIVWRLECPYAYLAAVQAAKEQLATARGNPATPLSIPKPSAPQNAVCAAVALLCYFPASGCVTMSAEPLAVSQSRSGSHRRSRNPGHHPRQIQTASSERDMNITTISRVTAASAMVMQRQKPRRAPCAWVSL
jgi:hypothetical protein